MAGVKLSAEQRVVISNIDWDTYVTISDKLGEHNLRINYDGANLEIMTTSLEHERAKHLLALLLSVLIEEMDINILGGGSMTFRREDLDRGFEPDECYWVQQEPQMRGRIDLDLTRDPPPDLMLEVEISRSFVDRLAIAARLGVREVWRWDGQTLRVMILGPDRQYTESTNSAAFPFLPLGELPRFLQQGIQQTEAQWLRAFRAWVREQITRGWGGAAPEAPG